MGQVGKYALHTALSLLKLKSEFHNSKFDSVDKDPDEWISHLEGLRIQTNKFSQKGSVSDEDFMIHVLNNLPNEYDVIPDGLENHLTVIGENALNIDSIREKLNHPYMKNQNKKGRKTVYNKQYKQQYLAKKVMYLMRIL